MFSMIWPLAIMGGFGQLFDCLESSMHIVAKDGATVGKTPRHGVIALERGSLVTL